MSAEPGQASIAGRFVAQRELYRSRRTVVELGSCEGRVLVAKRSAAALSARGRERARHEFQVLSQLDCAQVVKVVGLLEREGELLLEYVPGESLLELPAALELPEFFALAADICRALYAVHEELLVHRDVSPANLVRTSAGQVKLIDFDLATRISSESEVFRAPAQIEGTLAYMAPEQTGRTQRPLDQRADLYALGATFYYLLTKRPPFEARDPLELLHRHLAAPPAPLASVPPALDALVQKLLAKNPEDRYQSALGVLRDLERLRDGKLEVLAVDDVSPRLTLAGRLIGRERELETLAGAFGDVIKRGQAGVALVAGGSGVGKTALVRALRGVLVGTRGHALQGKFDPFQRDVPYSALRSALAAHVELLLAEPEPEREALRRRLEEALEDQVGPLLAQFPVLAPLFTATPPGEVVQRRGEQNLVRFLSCLATREQPLLLFLDDLQWADPASLAFLQRFAREGRWTLLVAAYRDEELGQSHPLHEQIALLEGLLSAQLKLGPLSAQGSLTFVAESLRLPAIEVAPLATVLHQRAGGVPFALGQGLLALFHEGALRMRDGRWWWQRERLDALAPSARVVDIGALRIARAPEQLRELLGWAACLGSEFALSELSALQPAPPAQIEQELARALDQGFLSTRGPGRYAFLHDRLREAAYLNRSDAERRAMHRAIAQSSPQEAWEGARLFELVRHLSCAVELSAARAELALSTRAAELSLLAARRAHDAGAFEASASYAEGCRTLLRAAGEQACDTYRAATLIYGEARYSGGRYAEAHAAYDELLCAQLEPTARADIYRQKATAKAVEGRISEAFAYFGLLARELGFDFNPAPSEEEAAGMVTWARESLAEFGCAELRELPACAQENASIFSDACAYFGALAYQARPAIFKALQSYTLLHAFDWGVSASAPPMITAWAVSAASTRDYALAREVASAGCLLAEKHSPPKVVARTRTSFALFAAHYQLDADDLLDELRLCADTCAAQGDLEYAGYARAEHDGLALLLTGAPADVKRRLAHSLRWADELQVAPCLRATTLTRAFAAALSGEADPGAPAAAFAALSAWSAGLALARQVLFGDYAAAARSYDAYLALRTQLEGTFAFTLFAFFGGVALARASVDGGARAAQLSEARELVALHADVNPGLSGPYAALLALSSAAFTSGSRADPRASADPHALAARYDALIERTRVCRLPLLSALACALAGEDLEAHGQTRLARSFADDAQRAYADLSLYALARRVAFAHRGVALAAAEHGTFLADARALDLWAVVKASQILAGELRVVPLISRLLTIACESAGAQRAVLILRVGELLEVAADLRDTLEVLSLEPLEGSQRVPAPLLAEAFVRSNPLLVHDVAQDAKCQALPYFQRAQVRSLLCLPVQRGEQRVGLLYLENALTAGAFPPSRIEVLRVLASQAAVSLENGRLLREEGEKQQLVRELEAAAEIQRALVPVAPSLNGAEVCLHMAPAARVGGDYFDVLRAGEHEWFVMADVCGHGLPAGLIMIMCQTALHAVLRAQPEIDPASALAQVNGLLKGNLERFGSSSYVAMTLFRRSAPDLIEYAGLHEEFLLYRAASRAVERHATSGTWLGVVDDLAPLLTVERLSLARGDVLLLFTDGLVDARGADGKMWGREALAALLEASGALPLATIRARILAALEGYRASDDVSLFLLRS